MMFRILIVAAATACFAAGAHARLEYDPESGWYHTQSELESRLTKAEYDAALALMNEAAERQAEGELGAAISRYKKVYRRYRDSVFAPEARLQAGRLYLRRNQFESAFEQFREILRGYPEFPKFEEVIESTYEIAEDIARGEHPRLLGVIPYFRNYNDAIDYYDRIVAAAPYSDVAPRALLDQARLAERNGEEAVTIDALDRLINFYPDSAQAPDAYLMLADTFAEQVRGPWYDQGPTREAISYYRDFLILFPRHRGYETAEDGLAEMQNVHAGSKFLMGNFYYKYRDNPVAALTFYNAAITIDPQSEYAERAREQIARIKEGKIAPRTPVDWLFPEFRNPDREPFERIRQGIDEPEVFEEETVPGPGQPETISPLAEDGPEREDPLDESGEVDQVPVEEVEQERPSQPIRGPRR